MSISPGMSSGILTSTVAFSPLILILSIVLRNGFESAFLAAFSPSPPRPSTRLAVRAALETCV